MDRQNVMSKSRIILKRQVHGEVTDKVNSWFHLHLKLIIQSYFCNMPE